MHEVIQEPLGVRVEDLSVRAIGSSDVRWLRTLLADHGVIIVPGQDIDDQAFVEFLRSFGELTFSAGEQPLPDYPDLNLISNVGRDRPPRSSFHIDTSYISTPPAYTALRAVQIPQQGGQTLFTNQYYAYETLPEEVRSRLAGRTITHVVTGIDPGPGEQTEAEHPVFRPHPVTGRVALYLSTPRRCRSISGLDPSESEKLIGYLLEHSTREDNVYRHTWSAGDVVMWDNGCVLHRADHDGVIGDRVMHRGMVADYAGAGLRD